LFQFIAFIHTTGDGLINNIVDMILFVTKGALRVKWALMYIIVYSILGRAGEYSQKAGVPDKTLLLDQ
jgi:hypothetical protein